MSAITRAWRYVTRQRIRTLMLLLVLTISTTSLMIVSSVGQATQRTADLTHETIGAGVTLSNNPLTNPGTAQGWALIPKNIIEKIEKLPGVQWTSRKQIVVADLVNAKGPQVQELSELSDSDYRKKFGNAVTVEGTNRSEGSIGFLTHSLSLSEGRHLSDNDVHACLVHEDVARENGLKVGDTLTLRTNPYVQQSWASTPKEVQTTIVGLVRGKNSGKVKSREELYSNTVYTDLTTTGELNSSTPGNEIFQEATFFTDHDTTSHDLISSAKQLSVPWDKYSFKENSNYLVSIFSTIDGIRSIVRSGVVAAILISSAVLTLVLLLWARERRKETGILLAVGRSKTGVTLQRFLELALIALPAFAISFPCAHLCAQKFGDQALGSATRSALEEMATAGQFGNDIATAQTSRTLSSISVIIDTPALLITGGLLAVVVIASVLMSSIPMLRRSPRELIGVIS